MPDGTAGTERCALVGYRGAAPDLNLPPVSAVAPVLDFPAGKYTPSVEQLTRTAIRLARRNEALEDFAALVAHELKTPLHAALVGDDPYGPVESALDLVESLLEAARTESTERTFASVSDSVDLAVEDLRADLKVTSNIATMLPLPAASLRVILRNLLGNAIAAGARHVHVTAVRTPWSWQLLVDDDGIGLNDADQYASGSGLGLSLSRRIAERFGGTLTLAPRSEGGTRATLELTEANQ